MANIAQVQNQNHEHLFVHDFYHGISLEEAERRIKKMMNSLVLNFLGQGQIHFYTTV